MTVTPGADAPAQPVQLQKYPRKSVSLPEPTHRILEHVAVHRGLTMTGMIYLLARQELATQENAASWSKIPSPFVVRPTHTSEGVLVDLWTPFHARPALMTRSETTRLADALTAYADGGPAGLDFRTQYRGQRVHLKRGSHHISIFIDGDSYAVTRETAREVAIALDNASVGALDQVAPEALQRAA